MEFGVKVLVIEEDQELRESMVEYLQTAGCRAVGVGNALACYRALAEHSFSVAVTDICLPDQSGYVLIEYMRKNIHMGIIIVSSRNTMEDRIQGFQSGADIYLAKPVDTREMAAAIISLAGRMVKNTPGRPRSFPVNYWHLCRASWCLVPPSGKEARLTAKEYRFLVCLAASPGTAVNRATILATLGYGDDEYSSRAMDSLVRRLRRKIETQVQIPPPIKTVHGVGYCFSTSLIIS